MEKMNGENISRISAAENVAVVCRVHFFKLVGQ